MGRPVTDKTPVGRVPLCKRATQVARDITRQTSVNAVCGIIRGILADRSQYRSVGVIGHSTHTEGLKRLGALFDPRIARTAYFGSGEERSSNRWYRECDLIVIAGTPRISPKVVRTHLCRLGEFDAAGDDPGRGEMHWRGRTESGDTRVVRGRGYEHPAWKRAHGDLVRATLVQAIGRGRGLLEDGCDVLVLSNEPCGLRLDTQETVEQITETDVAILDSVYETIPSNTNLTPETPKRDTIGKTGVSTADLGACLSISRSVVRDRASHLESRGMLFRLGERSGWLPVFKWRSTAADDESPTGDAHCADVGHDGRCDLDSLNHSADALVDKPLSAEGPRDASAGCAESGSAMNEAEATRFTPTNEWQVVPDGALLPPGLEIRMEFGRATYARQPPSEDLP